VSASIPVPEIRKNGPLPHERIEMLISSGEKKMKKSAFSRKTGFKDEPICGWRV
jgi:hypothetical protein